ncbi:iron chelate uptake ABC transporter family permease subunit [Oceanospirillum sediminis]|uniref:Iron chelate uptake ABC transporter family permease subunit n=1 Tax=Oceanospirillum sediminis TaxID=2760088 RepID=A0A839ILQ5_9GAMM|nr:iron chelate uptake ABC transporter family permease subunit [Oceanospirillum sediminis]MBB1485417.1 iron chelate uptake ABC transporter family permease subunit [Oceanospirillum sediminis]
MYPRLTLLCLPVVLLALVVSGVLLGSLDLQTALEAGPGILTDLRLSRVLVAVLAGAGLGLAGAMIQGVVRNPLASPDVIGVTTGAGAAATALLLVFPDIAFSWMIPSAISGALLTMALMLWLIRHQGLNPARLVLTGVALSAWLAAITDWLLVSHPFQVNAALVWLTGSLWGRGWDHVAVLLPWFLILVPLTLVMALKLDLLALGDETAEGLGADVRNTRKWALLLSVALAAVSVAVCGAVSFVGLISPHLARLLVGGTHRRLLPATAMIGAVLVLLADILARTLAPPVELPAGVLTSLIGAPYFLFLLTRYRGW